MSDLLQFTNFGEVVAITAGPPGTSEPSISLHDVVWDSVAGKAYTCTDPTFGSQTWAPPTVPPILSSTHPDLVAMHTMDNIVGSTLFDETANGSDGTIVGGLTTAVGKVGDSLSLSASGYVNFPSASALGTFVGEFTICTWIKTTHNVGTTNSGIISRYNSAVNERNFLLVQNGSTEPAPDTLRVLLSGSGTAIDVDIKTTGTYNDGLWHFVAITFIPSVSVTLDIDNGVETVTTTAGIPSSIPASALNSLFTLGMFNNVIETRWVGYLDQMRVFNRNLTPQEITELYNET